MILDLTHTQVHGFFSQQNLSPCVTFYETYWLSCIWHQSIIYTTQWHPSKKMQNVLVIPHTTRWTTPTTTSPYLTVTYTHPVEPTVSLTSHGGLHPPTSSRTRFSHHTRTTVTLSSVGVVCLEFVEFVVNYWEVTRNTLFIAAESKDDSQGTIEVYHLFS